MLDKYKEDMLLVKKSVKKIIKNDNDKINSIISNFFKQGGKGVRPLLTLVCSKLGKFSNKEDVINIAVIVEIIHTTTLIHDDIIDKATERRGNITLNNLYDNKTALFIGDFLFSRVLKEVSKIQDERIHYYLSKTLKNLCLGEIIQHNDLFNIKTRRIDYLKKIRNKTAILIAFACVSGAIISKANSKDIEASYKFGYYLGMSYQIIDDYLDFVGNEKHLGKDVGQDLINGNITLPVILKIKKNYAEFENLEQKNLLEKKQLIEKIKDDKEVLAEVKLISNKYLKKAQESIKNIDEKVKDDLLLITNKLYNRKN